ncbi:unnamed protein product [Didymodactylos carnosus]|uniref:Uncharacterized protein n=1 Tax=Didymodactylos carnosus TaxID=1234261 RepID=A0A813YG03_9BILA|nr:unnamed protein product [Didymodactylos carnosus]CAF1370597.1 unnamed protein product [Didymodactylos carnosus]CAF3669342.1 unnamed protein product [Didymodactylos carnosus]CAF4179836.1 unnamed protein product [Didymodactylos carnosus]
MVSPLLLLLKALIVAFIPIPTRAASIYFLNNSSQHETITTTRSVRLKTDNLEYYLRCSYNMTNIQIITVSYSSLRCTQIYMAHYQYEKPICSSIHKTYCLFYPKPIRLDFVSCPFPSDYVDITYQCSSIQIYLSTVKQKNNQKLSKGSTTRISKTMSVINITQYHDTVEYTNHLSDNIGVFFIGLSIIGVLSLLACCIWLIRYDTKRNNHHRRNDGDYYSERIPLEHTPTTISSPSPLSSLIDNEKHGPIQINDNDTHYNDLTSMQLQQNDHYCEHCLINNNYYPDGRRYSTILDYKTSCYGLELNGIVGNLAQSTGFSSAQVVDDMHNNNNMIMVDNKNIIRIDNEPCTCHNEHQSDYYNTSRSVGPLTTNSVLSLSRQSKSSQNSSTIEMYTPSMHPLSTETTSNENCYSVNNNNNNNNRVLLTTNSFENTS